ncbi:MAG: GTPase RsgA, partial [Pseudomonadales bacterium]|nr:GTPase RsgA [Pseudomonadales bacterium]
MVGPELQLAHPRRVDDQPAVFHHQHFTPGGRVPALGITFTDFAGVGKSTIINALLGREQLDTGEVREGDAKGRHTTT